MNTLLNAIDKDKAIVSQRRAKAVAIKIITHVLSLRYLSTDEIVERLEKLIMWQHGTIAYNLGNSAALTFST